MENLKKPFPGAAILMLFVFLADLMGDTVLFLLYLISYNLDWIDAARYAFFGYMPEFLLLLLYLALMIVLLCKQKNIVNIFPLALLSICSIWILVDAWARKPVLYNVFNAFTVIGWLLLTLLAVLLACNAKGGLKIWFLPGLFFAVALTLLLVAEITRIVDNSSWIIDPYRYDNLGFNLAYEFIFPFFNLLKSVLLLFAAFSMGKWFYAMADLKAFHAKHNPVRYAPVPPRPPVPPMAPVPPMPPRVPMSPVPPVPPAPTFRPAAPAQPAQPVVPNRDISAADALKKYKELLDLGAITPEEYEAKKKQLLGL